MDSIVSDVDESVFNLNADWKDFYREVVEEDHHGMPEPLRKPVYIRGFVDADHGGNIITRRPHTGILLFVSNALIKFYSKQQNTVELSTFGSELVALRIARDMFVEIRIKLKMMGVPLAGPANVFCDNNLWIQQWSCGEYQHPRVHPFKESQHHQLPLWV